MHQLRKIISRRQGRENEGSSGDNVVSLGNYII
jgi:hypothetical protein